MINPVNGVYCGRGDCEHFQNNICQITHSVAGVVCEPFAKDMFEALKANITPAEEKSLKCKLTRQEVLNLVEKTITNTIVNYESNNTKLASLRMQACTAWALLVKEQE